MLDPPAKHARRCQTCGKIIGYIHPAHGGQPKFPEAFQHLGNQDEGSEFLCPGTSA